MEDERAGIAVDEEVFGASPNIGYFMLTKLKHRVFNGPAHATFTYFNLRNAMIDQVRCYSAPGRFYLRKFGHKQKSNLNESFSQG